MQVGRGLLPRVLPGAGRSRQPRLPDPEHPKVVGGVTPACTRVGTALYRQRSRPVVPVTSTQVAEMVKLLENTFRSVNIGLVNEMALMCDRMGIDVWEVIEAAATKPFGFMPFYPGPGLGGHCIPIDPVLPVVEGAGERLRGALHRAGGPGQRADARSRRATAWRRRSTPGKAVRGLPRAGAGRRVQGGHRRRSRESRRSTSWRPCVSAARASSYSRSLRPDARVRRRTLRGVPLRRPASRRFDCVVIATAHKSVPIRDVVRQLEGRRGYPQRAQGPALAEDRPSLAALGLHSPDRGPEPCSCLTAERLRAPRLEDQRVDPIHTKPVDEPRQDGNPRSTADERDRRSAMTQARTLRRSSTPAPARTAGKS